MKRLLNFKSIRMKVLFGFSQLIVLVLILTVFNVGSIMKVNEQTKDIIEYQLPLLIADERLAFNMAQQTALARGYVIYGDQEYKDLFNEYTDRSLALQEELLATTNSEKVVELVEKSNTWRGIIINEVFPIYDQGDSQGAVDILSSQAQTLGREVMNGFEEMAYTRETLAIEQGHEIINSGQNTLLVTMILSGLVFIIGVTVALITAQVITNPIKVVMNRMNAISTFDLSEKPLDTSSRDEIGQLVMATNRMSENTRNLIDEITGVSKTVTNQSEELTQAANEVKAGSQQTAVTMQELAAGAETQASAALGLANVMESFSTKIQEANEDGEKVKTTSMEVKALTTEGSQLMDSSIKQMKQIDEIVQDSVQKVKGLDAQSQQISTLVSVIKDIAAQTNLLALNAAIEAARAGDHGRGFAVVADEVRKLAEQVTESVTEITTIVGGIQSESTAVANSLESGYEEVKQGIIQIKTTGETFTRINQAVTDMAISMETVSNNLKTISTNNEKMNASIQEMASVSEESAAGIEQTSASAEQVSSSMEEVANNSDELAQLAEKLNVLVQKFKL
ncbi:methyl-accepting chemotaxis protein [Halalkalibacter akibai]|uniref:Methyl-accepting chemotaxis protein n=1 Tax=Halalkalibacter akibai (strain ATCC 43226 / DSM 21942 / CIP 109018 / JCM 9157 / 1139) TaxID=1236973 RepID=W4QP84_HALA3|nr:methyl-accepting chemotaxis protein [Halalkalibacter akibai]GAE33727.1 methyl-accepting chemotaxis protein [Halalkalibacter akibai JCM 9157]